MKSTFTLPAVAEREPHQTPSTTTSPSRRPAPEVALYLVIVGHGENATRGGSTTLGPHHAARRASRTRGVSRSESRTPRAPLTSASRRGVIVGDRNGAHPGSRGGTAVSRDDRDAGAGRDRSGDEPDSLDLDRYREHQALIARRALDLGAQAGSERRQDHGVSRERRQRHRLGRGKASEVGSGRRVFVEQVLDVHPRVVHRFGDDGLRELALGNLHHEALPTHPR